MKDGHRIPHATFVLVLSSSGSRSSTEASIMRRVVKGGRVVQGGSVIE